MNASEKSPSRRGILAALGLGGAAAAALSTLPAAKQSAADSAPPPRPKPEKGGGYALTDHVKRYYQTTRL